VVQITTPLVWSKKGDGHLAAGANLALQAFADLSQGEVCAQVKAEFGEAKAGGVETGLTGTAVVVLVGDVFEKASFQSSVVHRPECTIEALWIAAV